MSERFVIRPEDPGAGWPVAERCARTLRQVCERLKREGGAPVEVVIGEYRRRRSLEQNRLYWSAYVRPLAEHCGVSSQAMHRWLKWEFLEPELVVDPFTGEILREGEPTTTGLTTAEFNQYLEMISAMAAEQGVHLPAPGEHAATYGWPEEAA
ncbi:hypothetical protein [Halorhodospira sp. 9622]|uniref:hypothetical protein n=1 Tax=Halorhodospira sp. 9622 TaxID=2899136 RepID=UPI001EE8D7CB|nr:hypothetical protein [Halorhodospira sp. 9622]MCG5538970.1 hypothetical protein [Halorhodospira sp. 9622]